MYKNLQDLTRYGTVLTNDAQMMYFHCLSMTSGVFTIDNEMFHHV